MLTFCLVESIGKRRCCRLVDQPDNLESSYLSCILRGLTLCIVEIRRDSDDCFRDLLSEECLCIILDLPKNEPAYLLRRVGLPEDADRIVGSHLPLDRLDRALGIQSRLTARWLPYEHLPILRKCNIGRNSFPSDAHTLGCRHDRRLSANHYCCS